MPENRGMMHKVVLLWALVAFFVALAVGFILGMYAESGKLKDPKAGASYDLGIVAKSGKGVDARYYSLEKYYPDAEVLKKDLLGKKAFFENGVFRIEESGKDKK